MKWGYDGVDVCSHDEGIRNADRILVGGGS